MHKLLLSVVLAILMVLAVVGAKNVLAPGGSTLVAGGSAPAPPIPVDN